MKILVIDDSPANIASARTTLKGHEVVTIDKIGQAVWMLNSAEPFDAVLTDLFMPLGDFVGQVNYLKYARPQGNLPAGLVFALKAANRGIRTVIVTDADHHSDWICTLLDLVGSVYKASDPQYNRGDINQTVAYVEARYADLDESTSDGTIVKDWWQAMKRSGLFTELDFGD